MKPIFFVFMFLLAQRSFGYTEVWCWGSTMTNPGFYSQEAYGWSDLPQIQNVYQRRQYETRAAQNYALNFVNNGCQNVDGFNCAYVRCRISRQYP